MSAWHHDGEDFWDVTGADVAAREAEESISRWRPIEDGDGWPDEFVERVAWGILVQDARFLTHGAACSQCGEHMAAVLEGVHLDSTGAECDGEVVPVGEYELRDAPDLAERIAEVLSTRPTVTSALFPLLTGGELGDLRGTVDQIRRAIGMPEGSTNEEVAAAVERMAELFAGAR